MIRPQRWTRSARRTARLPSLAVIAALCAAVVAPPARAAESDAQCQGASADAKPLAVASAVKWALQNRADVISAQLGAQRAKLLRASASARFVPSAAMQMGYEQSSSQQDYLDATLDYAGAQLTAGVNGRLPTGTSYALSALHTNNLNLIGDKAFTFSSVQADLWQPLLRNNWWHEGTHAEVAQASAVLAESQLHELREQVAEEIILAYWSLSAVRELCTIAVKARELSEQLFSLTRAKIKAGLLPNSALAQVAAEVARRNAEVAAAGDAVAGGHVDLLAALGSGDRNQADRLHAVVPLSLSEHTPQTESVLSADALTGAINAHPRVRTLRALEQERLAQRALLDWRAYPDVTVRGRAGLSATTAAGGELINDGLSPWYYVGVEVTVPIGADQDDIELQRADLALQQVIAQLAESEHQLRISAEAAGRRWGLQEATITARRQSVAAMQQALQTETAAFKRGQSTRFEVTRSQEKMIASQGELVQALYAREVARIRYYRIMGRAVAQTVLKGAADSDVSDSGSNR